jgi:hypothetical protein
VHHIRVEEVWDFLDCAGGEEFELGVDVWYSFC